MPPAGAGDTTIDNYARFGSPAEVICDMACPPQRRPHRRRQQGHARRAAPARQRAQHGVAQGPVQRAHRRHHRFNGC